MIVILKSLLKCLLKYLLKCVILGKTGAYILGVSLKSVFLSTFSVRWKSMSVQSYKYRNAMDVSQVPHDVRTHDQECVAYRSVSDIVLWSIIEFSTGVKVYDTSFAIEWARQALKMLIKLSMWSEL